MAERLLVDRLLLDCRTMDDFQPEGLEWPFDGADLTRELADGERNELFFKDATDKALEKRFDELLSLGVPAERAHDIISGVFHAACGEFGR